MARVKLGDVAREYKATCGDQKEGLRVVGLEHLIPQQIILTLWDEGKENTFTKMFKKGQVLFGRRRAYLMKAAVAPFDGICSGDITVIEAIPGKILPELLPFIIQNDTLFDFAVERSAGSLSPRVKWEHLKNFEFELPELDRQKELADILWASERAKTAYRELISSTDELVKSQFIEMFGTTKTFADRWELQPIKSCCQIISGYPFNSKLFNEIAEGTPLIRIRDVMRGYTETYTTEITDDSHIIHEGDLLIGMDGDFGISKWKSSPAFLNQRVCKISGNIGVINNEFLLYFLAPWLKEVNEGTMFATVKHISIKQIESAMIPVVDYHTQERFASFVEQLDKSKSLYELTAQNQVMGGVRCA